MVADGAFTPWMEMAMSTTEPHPDPTARRVLPHSPYVTLKEYEAFGGG
jgi:hypothetical protein